MRTAYLLCLTVFLVSLTALAAEQVATECEDFNIFFGLSDGRFCPGEKDALCCSYEYASCEPNAADGTLGTYVCLRNSCTIPASKTSWRETSLYSNSRRIEKSQPMQPSIT